VFPDCRIDDGLWHIRFFRGCLAFLCENLIGFLISESFAGLRTLLGSFFWENTGPPRIFSLDFQQESKYNALWLMHVFYMKNIGPFSL